MKTIIHFSLLIHLITATDIWYYQGDQLFSSLWPGITTNLINDPVCPGTINNNCWSLTTTGNIERTISTIGFTNIQLTYYMSTGDENLNAPSKSCDIDYSIDGSQYTNINQCTSGNQDLTGTYNAWGLTVNDQTLRIRLTNTVGGYSCYFNDLRLFGTTPAPTKTPTNNPSVYTNQPSKTPSNIPSNSPSKTPTITTITPSKTPSDNPSEIPSNSPTITTLAPSKIPTTTIANPTNMPTNSPTEIPIVIWHDDMGDPAVASWTGTHSGMGGSGGNEVRFNGGDNIYRTTDVSNFYFIYVTTYIRPWGSTIEQGEYIHLQYQINGQTTGWIDVQKWSADE
eukprot:412215_1